MKTITLPDWTAASIEERHDLLEDGVSLDRLSAQVLSWAQAFKDAGAAISDSAMNSVYRDQVRRLST